MSALQSQNGKGATYVIVIEDAGTTRETVICFSGVKSYNMKWVVPSRIVPTITYMYLFFGTFQLVSITIHSLQTFHALRTPKTCDKNDKKLGL